MEQGSLFGIGKFLINYLLFLDYFNLQGMSAMEI